MEENSSINKVSRREQGLPMSTDLSPTDAEAPEGFEWYDREAALLQCTRCERLVYVDQLDRHELNAHADGVEVDLPPVTTKIE